MDCLQYLKQLPDHSVDLVVTDPPYNVSQKSNIQYKNLKIVKNFGESYETVMLNMNLLFLYVKIFQSLSAYNVMQRRSLTCPLF